MDTFEALNTTRLLFFMETNPQSNEYHQIILNDKQFKKMSDALASCFEKVEEEDLRDGFEMFELKMSDDTYKLPDLQETV